MRYHLTPYDGCLVAKSCLTLGTPRAIACQAPLSIRFSRQEYWSGLPFPPPGAFPEPEIEPAFPVSPPTLQKCSLPTEPSRKPP